MVSQDGEIGASKLTGEVIDIMNKISAQSQSFTGRSSAISVSLSPQIEY
jgi:hypothetical protein